MDEYNEDSPDSSVSDASEVLADPYCRYLLYCLYRRSTPMRLPAIADKVTVWELHAPATDHLEERLRIYMELYHDYLPLLCDLGVVEYSQADDEVSWGAAAEDVKPALKRYLQEESEELRRAEDE